MKKIYTTLVAVFAIIQISSAQWTGGPTGNVYYNGGNVGIGTTSPGAKLDLGNVNSSNPYVQALIYSGNIQYAQGIGVNLGQSPNAMSMLIGGYSGASAGAASFEVVSANSLTFPYTSYTTRFMVSSNGNVGIGTTTPDAKLAVNGTIHTKEVKVETNNWPDYVFKPTYKLPSLLEVKTYIEKNKHLQEMPSEQEVAKNGINLGEIVKLQTKKIEELTLYLIEQQKQMDQLKQQLNTVTKALIKN
jgi:uncharacterized coiled-coil protein SlyX